MYLRAINYRGIRGGLVDFMLVCVSASSVPDTVMTMFHNHRPHTLKGVEGYRSQDERRKLARIDGRGGLVNGQTIVLLWPSSVIVITKKENEVLL